MGRKANVEKKKVPGRSTKMLEEEFEDTEEMTQCRRIGKADMNVFWKIVRKDGRGGPGEVQS